MVDLGHADLTAEKLTLQLISPAPALSWRYLRRSFWRRKLKRWLEKIRPSFFRRKLKRWLEKIG
jgi:hypothetical protein